VLDLVGFCYQERHDPPAIILFREYQGRISRILEHKQEHEHELSTSVFGFKEPPLLSAPAAGSSFASSVLAPSKKAS
jgi:hypothetical protein